MMQTLVLNGEPVVYGETHLPAEYYDFFRQAGEDVCCVSSTWDQIRDLINQARRPCERDNKLRKLRLTTGGFAFFPECCSEHSTQWDAPSVEVIRVDKWGSKYWTNKRINGCSCPHCTGANTFKADSHIRDKLKVRFNV